VSANGVVVLGAGLSGLGCADELPGARIFEARSAPGGHATSHAFAGAWFDEGAHISHSVNPAFLRHVLPHAPRLHEIHAAKVRNYWHGRWCTYPVQNHLHELSEEDRIAALTDFVAAQAGAGEAVATDYAAWCRRQYGEFLTQRFYAEYTAKYWRVPMEELATDWLSGRLLPGQVARVVAGAIRAQPEEQAAFARFRYPAQGGFQALFGRQFGQLGATCNERAMAVNAQRRCVRFASGREESYEALATSIPMPDLVAMLEDCPAELRTAAQTLRHTKLLCVNVVLNMPRVCDDHWFYVYDADLEAARVSVPSNLAPDMLPPEQSALQAEVFRRADEPWDVTALTEETVSGLTRILPFTMADVATVSAVEVSHAYPISDQKRGPASESIARWLEARRIFPMGLFGRWRYIWSDAAYLDGRDVGACIRKELSL